ncbi:hypothetical protein Strvi_6033 [Streptomyces violaceusniger Tu 4113]|uniref:Helix-turn-helix domain-containing protein n=1 Tax=Streptomyces violaceusniger (strain Tu 4113) TaxID=653045 RepID=G2PGF0_STRV4|nr:hypothetical protein Strvi_6033 [Streptomyces violaceusniger Tu 4113]
MDEPREPGRNGSTHWRRLRTSRSSRGSPPIARLWLGWTTPSRLMGWSFLLSSALPLIGLLISSASRMTSSPPSLAGQALSVPGLIQQSVDGIGVLSLREADAGGHRAGPARSQPVGGQPHGPRALLRCTLGHGQPPDVGETGKPLRTERGGSRYSHTRTGFQPTAAAPATAAAKLSTARKASTQQPVPMRSRREEADQRGRARPAGRMPEASLRRWRLHPGLAELTGRSYGFVHRMLSEVGADIRGRGGAAQGNRTTDSRSG